MTLKELLLSCRETVTKRWTEAVHGSYPFGTIGFLRTQSNRFANPVGYRTGEAATALFAALLADDPNQKALGQALDDLIRVRAIQDFSPEEAVGVIFLLKRLLWEEIGVQIKEHGLVDGFRAVEEKIDACALMSFGIYARCRESIHMMRAEEFRRGQAQLLRRAERIISGAADGKAGADSL